MKETETEGAESIDNLNMKFVDTYGDHENLLGISYLNEETEVLQNPIQCSLLPHQMTSLKETGFSKIDKLNTSFH